MIINFRIRGISQGIFKLVRTSTLIRKKIGKTMWIRKRKIYIIIKLK